MQTPSDQSYRLIPLTQEQFAKVDPADYEWLSKFRWHARWSPCTHTFYAVRSSPRVDGKQHPIHMHREIMGLKKGDGLLCDHREPSETLDNRRSNLRIATRRQNNCNQRLSARNTSGFKGVWFYPRGGKKVWHAAIRVDGKHISLGYFAMPEEAARAYAEAAMRFNGEFARTE